MLAWTVNPWFLWTMTILGFIHFEITGMVLLLAAAMCLFWPGAEMRTKLKSVAFLLYLYALTTILAWFGVALGWFVISDKVQAWRHEANIGREQPEECDA